MVFGVFKRGGRVWKKQGTEKGKTGFKTTFFYVKLPVFDKNKSFSPKNSRNFGRNWYTFYEKGGRKNDFTKKVENRHLYSCAFLRF